MTAPLVRAGRRRTAERDTPRSPPPISSARFGSAPTATTAGGMLADLARGGVRRRAARRRRRLHDSLSEPHDRASRIDVLTRLAGIVAERANRLAMALERRSHDPPCHLRLALVDRLHGGVEHQRDPGQALHGPVVEEEREPAPFVLLGRDDPLDQALALVGGDLIGHQSMIASRNAMATA